MTTMKKDIFENVSKKELLELLKVLKLYKDLTKKLGNRGKKLFKSIISGKSLYKLEYFSGASRKDSLDEAIKVYKKFFNDNVSIEDIDVLEKSGLEGGIKVFKDDNLVNLSFKKASEILK